MKAFLTRLVRDEEGLTTVEYAIMLVLVATAGLAAWWSLGGSVRQVVHTGTEEIAEAGL